MNPTLVKQTELYTGKAKSLYETNDPDYLIAVFRDDTTAFDGQKQASLQAKGAVNNAISTFLMRHLESSGIPTHFVQQINETDTVVKRLTMIPLENVIRNIATGSLCRRLGVESGLSLSPPLYELFLKNDDLHDPLINESHATSFGWATSSHLDQMRDMTFSIHKILTDLFAEADLTLVDAKYEFGISKGSVILGDEISPDSCRVWDRSTGESLDKDRFRQSLGGVVESYQIIAERLGVSVSTTV
tara:strand:+ start:413 stop:1147 length:735 start_codon:yes stop_codon:yes gene_type:complete